MSCRSSVPCLSSAPLTLHLLSDPGSSLLLQQSLDGLLKCVFPPGLRLFHVSERACPLHTHSNPRPASGHPFLTITLFLQESPGQQRILRVLDILKSPPWHFHHTEGGGSYLLPSRDVFGLGVGLPLWAVRPVHCGPEILRVTLHTTHDNFEDTVRLYETVLGRRAEAQKSGFCWFPLLSEPCFGLQVAVKQLSVGVRVQTCPSAILQFSVGEIGQLVPLLPNTCAPISSTRWHTEDLDGNKILFQVRAPAQTLVPLRSAFPTLSSSRSASRLRECVDPHGPSSAVCFRDSPISSGVCFQDSPRSGVCFLDSPRSGVCFLDSLGSDGTSRSPPGSSCYSSQRSSPSGPALENTLTRRTLEERDETNVDTGRSVSADEGRCHKNTLTERTHTWESPRQHTHYTAEDEFFI